jgi:hypothetical protein
MWTEIIARLHLSPGNVAVVGGGMLAMILTCLFCWFRGARPDRIGAAVFAACWLGDFVVVIGYLWMTGDQRPPMLSDAVWDTIPGLTFLWLAIRYDNLWLGAVALIQGVQFALDAADHAIHEPIGAPLPFILIFSLDMMNFAMMAAMIGSVVSGRRRAAAARSA